MAGLDEQFCLKWNNFQSTVTLSLPTLREEDAFVDVTLCAEGLTIKAHKVVLSASSDHFKSILKVCMYSGVLIVWRP